MTTHQVGYFLGSLRALRSIANLQQHSSSGTDNLFLRRDFLQSVAVLYSPDYDPDFPQVAKNLKFDQNGKSNFVFTPRINRSIRGALKNAIDWASRPYGQNALTRKPTAVIGVSPGAIGTAVAQQSLRSVLGFCNPPQINAPRPTFSSHPDSASPDAGEVTVASTEEFLRTHMQSFHDFLRASAFRASARCLSAPNPVKYT